MAQAKKKLREPKVPYLFRTIWPEAARRIEARRFAGLRNRQGIDTPNDVTLYSQVEYFTNRETKDTHSRSIADLEAKSAYDDQGLKFFGSFVFSIIFFLSLLCVGFDEIRAVFISDPNAWRPGNVFAAALVLVLAYIVLFGGMLLNFNGMDHKWSNCVDSFFANGAAAQMEAVRDAMREFKRFVKWRRYMRLMMQAAVFILGVEIALLLFSEQIGQALGFKTVWSPTEVKFAAGFLAAQAVWLVGYWWIWVYYTAFRDPTLQLCIMVNVLDRQRVAPNIAGKG